MRKTIALMLISTMVLASCGSLGSSRLNPANWFGRATSTENTASTNPLIPKRAPGAGLLSFSQEGPYVGWPVDQITALRVERTQDGAIIRIEAVAARQGSFHVRVVPDNELEEPVNGVLSYTLKAVFPQRTAVGTVPSRKIVAAHYLNDKELEGVRTIRVAGQRNTLSVRR